MLRYSIMKKKPDKREKELVKKLLNSLSENEIDRLKKEIIEEEAHSEPKKRVAAGRR